ncbi:MAG: MerR family transcriptional regulator [Deltaproteobacteria bacterium]|nr:MerR family transcriptional regulator [Candidatus Anaeroferrophillacea bacterium]
MDRIPDKLFFRIGEVSDIVDVKPYVLRYWESEFDLVAPQKSPTRQRLYQRCDLEMLLEIKRLLYVEGFTIAGAKKKLKQGLKTRQRKAPALDDGREALATVRQELEEIRKLLRSG